MSTPWQQEVPVSRPLVEQLLQSQCPDLDLGDLRHAGAGWDHDVWRCGDTVLRFPHQRESFTLAADHVAKLRFLSGLLSIPIPTPTHVGEPTEAYPGTFVGYRWIPGAICAQLPLTTEDRAACAEPMAQVLRALHDVPLETAGGWGVATKPRSGELLERYEYGQKRAAQLAGSRYASLGARALSAMVAIPEQARAHCLTHGDLHAGQILMDEAHRISGIIDWDELCIGDPAYDLMFVYAFIPPTARPRFWQWYGDFDGHERARYLALSYGLAILAQAVDGEQEALANEAAYSLVNALA